MRSLIGRGRWLPGQVGRAASCGAAAVIVMAACGAASAQPWYSVDYQGPMKALPDACTGTPISEGDILLYPGGPAIPAPPTPCIGIPAGPGGLGLPTYPVGGVTPGPSFVEVDALSFGTDPMLTLDSGMVGTTTWFFSVDEFAVGIPFLPAFPNVASEGAFGAVEASADVFMNPFLPPGPLGPPAIFPPFAGNTGVFDGNGLPSFSAAVYPGLGLFEPNPPTPGTVFDPGDNVDALDVDATPAAVAATYYSLDSGIFDPIEIAFNTGSAAANGPFVGGDVLVSGPGGPPALYAAAALLGLDLILGPDSDDLDALVLWENGIPGFQASASPYDWMIGMTDMLLFSVRRGSALIGAPDSIFGAPISEGDILTTPLAGGLSPFPGIFIAAEWLGLATVRSGLPTFMGFNDDLNALDVVPEPGTLLLLAIGGAAAAIRRRGRSGGRG